jgi:hypothetical protein
MVSDRSSYVPEDSLSCIGPPALPLSGPLMYRPIVSLLLRASQDLPSRARRDPTTPCA